MSAKARQATGEMNDMISRCVPTLLPFVVSHARGLGISKLSVGALDVLVWHLHPRRKAGILKL
jgi:hypothetical protein